MIETSIVIPTYNRPDDLARAIASCLTQRGAASPYEIIVVDNNPDGAARDVVGAAAQNSAVPIRYVAEPRPGISYARNAGVAASTARYIAFLDDDEEAEPQWLAAHLRAARDFSADIVAGAVHARFPQGIEHVDPYPRSRFSRDPDLPTGSAMPRLPGIGNTLLDRARCFTEPQPFDPEFGLTGGEDTVFLRQLLRRGRKLVWCAEAVVHEFVPAERLAPGMLLRRAFNSGQMTTFACAAARPRRPAQAARMMLAGIVQLVAYGPIAIALRLCRDRRWLPLMDRAMLGLGKLLWHPGLARRIYR